MSNRLISGTGTIINWTATAGKSVNALVTVGQMVGIAQITATTGALIPLAVGGVWTITKATSVGIAAGTPIFATSTGAATTTATANTLVGHTIAGATTAVATVGVVLKGAGPNAVNI